MQFRIADTFTDSLAKLTGDEQKVEERRHPPGGPLVGGQRFRMLTVTLRNGVELFRFSTGKKPTIGVFDTVDDEIAAVAGWLEDRRNSCHALRLREIARLRMIVGYLEEKGRHNWWPSEFFSATAPAFLNPVFGKTATLAQYHGVKEAARRVHAEHIGVGREFHLFCLPEAIETAVFEVLQDPAITEALRRNIESRDAAAAALQAIVDSTGSLREGPVRIGAVSHLDEGTRWLSDAARCYEAAFNAGSRSFPYLVDGP